MIARLPSNCTPLQRSIVARLFRIGSLWRALLICTIGAGLASLVGCEPRSENRTIKSGSGALQPNDNSAIWPFWPVRMRLHPLTRLTTDENGRMVIEARVEFFDVHGATTKGVGQLVLELLDASQPLQQAESLQVWNQDLRNLTVNQRQYDTVFRTYLFRLEVDPFKFPQQASLHAYFVSSNGQTLEDSMRLKR